MKFTDGYWQMRLGVTPCYPVQVHEVLVEPEALTVYATTRRLVERGDTLNTPLITVRFSSPMPDVIRVQISHHRGARPSKPEFELLPQPPASVTTEDNHQSSVLTSGRLSVRVEKADNWKIEFQAAGRVLTSSGKHGIGVMDTDSGRYIHEQLALGVGECVYGLGERFTAFVKNGQIVEMWNQDGGTSSEQAYKNIPFYLTNRGYGVFVNHPERVSFEVASEKVERVQFSVPGESLDYFIFYGPVPKEVLARYTALTGRPALPPAWSFGLWLSTSFTTDYDEATVTALIQGMSERGIPLSVFHFDCFWMKALHWCNFQWDTDLFPDPPAMLARLKSRGLRICLWVNPYIAQRSELFAEAAEKGYLIRHRNGEVWQTDQWQAGMGIVDFSNPQARGWYGEVLGALLDLGVDCFKTDFGERIPTGVVYAGGSDPQKMHNFYAYLYNQTVFKLLEERFGPNRAVLFARSATAGCQQFPVHWGGDCTATYESMAESLRAGLSLGLCGFGFWSHDIGGFEQTATPDLYKRWCAFGLLSSHSRLHGSSTYRVPWLFDEQAVDVLRFFTRLKCSLMPYLYGAAKEAQTTGAPVMRAMVIEFPDDPGCDMLDRQYMLGESLLVAPVFSPGGVVDYYLPPGRWTDYFTGKVRQGPGWRREQHGYLSLPLLVRPGAVLPVGSRDDLPDYDYSAGVTLRVYELADGSAAWVEIPTEDGGTAARFNLRQEGQVITVEMEGSATDWKLLLVGSGPVERVQGGLVEEHPQGVLVSAGQAKKVVVHLA
jgi:alpha-D-xyloside xylohydrolase